jgi:four helix bundle protein
MKALGFENLEVFKRAYTTSLDLHRRSIKFPRFEQYGLADQVRRASKGICANLAEGFAKQVLSKAEFKRFLVMAIGSSDEMRVWLRYCFDLGYIDKKEWEHWRSEYQQIAKMLHKLRQKA